MSRKKQILQQKLKDEAAKKALERQKKGRIAIIIGAGVVCGIIAGALIFDAVYVPKTDSDEGMKVDYSLGLDKNGMIKGVEASQYVTLADLESVSNKYEDYCPDQATVDAYVDSLLEACPKLDATKDIEVKKGDRISIDFVGYIDGEVYSPSDTGKQGTEMVIGESNYPGNFEEQIIGHKTGETFEVSVDYAEDFANTDIAGKTLVFEVTINGFLVKDEFTDEFLAEYGQNTNYETVDEYLDAYRELMAENSYDELISSKFYSESTVTEIPEKYLKELKELEKQQDEKLMETSNQSYIEATGSPLYTDVLDMKKMDKETYETNLETRAVEDAKEALIVQAAFEKYGLTVSEEAFNIVMDSYAIESYDEGVERFGEPYFIQQAMAKELEMYLENNFNIVK